MQKKLAAAGGIVALVGLLYISTFKTPDKKIDAQKINIENSAIGADKLISAFSPPNSESYKSGKDPISSGNSEKLRFNAGITHDFTKKLHDLSAKAEIDPAWSKEAKYRLNLLVKNLPYQSKEAYVQCGSGECEVSVYTLGGLSDYNKNRIIDLLAQPAYADENSRFFTVRQVWSNEDIGLKEPGFRAYYMKN